MHVTRGLRFPGMLSAVLILAGSWGFAGCASIAEPDATLYEQLNERRGIEQLVDRMLRAMADDESIAHHFRGIDVARFRKNLALHLCVVADGDCTYPGASMTEVHRGMAVSQADFNAVVEHLIHAMESLRVPVATQNDLLRRLAKMQGEIVERRWNLP